MPILKILSFKDGGTNLAELLSNALPSVNNRIYGKENTNLNDLNDGRIDLLLDNSPRSILDTQSTSSSATGSPDFSRIRHVMLYIYNLFLQLAPAFLCKLLTVGCKVLRLANQF